MAWGEGEVSPLPLFCCWAQAVLVVLAEHNLAAQGRKVYTQEHNRNDGVMDACGESSAGVLLFPSRGGAV